MSTCCCASRIAATPKARLMSSTSPSGIIPTTLATTPMSASRQRPSMKDSRSNRPATNWLPITISTMGPSSHEM
jgi:hypothetical protein